MKGYSFKALAEAHETLSDRSDGERGSIGRIMSPLLSLPLKNSLAMTQGVGDVSFSRASGATYIDRYGIVQKVLDDVPRFEKAGLLVEGESTNLVLISDGAQGLTGGSYTAGQTGPDGAATATLFTEDSLTSTHLVNTAIAVTAGTYSLSIFIKPNGRDTLRLMLNDGTNSPFVDFDVANKTISLESGATGKIDTLADGWLRLRAEGAVLIAATANFSVRPLLAGLQTYLGDGTSGFYYAGYQLEELPFASSYIPTTGAAATRIAEDCSITFQGNSPHGVDDGTVICDVSTLGGGVYHTIWSMYAGAGAQSRLIQWSNDVTRLAFGDALYNYGAGAAIDTVIRYGGTLEGLTSSLYADGVLEDSDLTASGMFVDTILGADSYELRLGAQPIVGAFPMYGHVSNFRIYDQALTAEEMRLA
jgi:hypothetical protein